MLIAHFHNEHTTPFADSVIVIASSIAIVATALQQKRPSTIRPAKASRPLSRAFNATFASFF